jgi:hypothetical protein
MMTDRIVRTLPVAVFLLLLVLPDASDASRAKATTKVITGYGSADSGEGGSNPMNTSIGTARLAALTAGNVPAVVLNGRETIKAVRQGFRPFRESGGGNRAHHRRSRHGQKFEFDLAPREMGLKEPPKPEQVDDFSLLDEITKR